MSLSFIFSCGILGLIFGSFLNAAVYRLHYKKNLFFGRSFCPCCRHVLAARDLVPLLSFILLRGKCRFCRKKISAHYFWIELIAAVAFVGVGLTTGSENFVLLAWQFFFTAILIFLASYDLQFGEVPDEVSLPAIIFALVGSFFFSPDFFNALIGLIAGGGFFMALVLVSRGKWMGGGDIRFGALLGALLGWRGFFIALFLASIIGSIVGVALLWQKKKQLESAVPFAPFLAIGGYVALLFGAQIWEWYVTNFFF